MTFQNKNVVLECTIITYVVVCDKSREGRDLELLWRKGTNDWVTLDRITKPLLAEKLKSSDIKKRINLRPDFLSCGDNRCSDLLIHINVRWEKHYQNA